MDRPLIIVFKRQENSQITMSGLIYLALHTKDLWCDELGLSVNPDKTGLVAFTRKRKLPGFF